MGGSKKYKKKNCSGCKGFHTGPWSPERCKFKKPSGDGAASMPSTHILGNEKVFSYILHFQNFIEYFQLTCFLTIQGTTFSHAEGTLDRYIVLLFT